MYESFYGLASKPFPLRPDPRSFYPSRGHNRAMSYLQYGLEQGEGFIVITGGIGTGKTTLVQKLFSEIDQENLIATQLVTTQLDADDLLRMVASSYGVPFEGLSKVSVLRNIEEFLIRSRHGGKRVLLVVDEAQNFPPQSLEELRMLSNFQLDNIPLLQTFLLGQEEFSQILHARNMEQLRQRVIATFRLLPLGRDEVRGYIECRLNFAGWSGDPSFSDEAFETIFEYTRGIPRKVNTLCDRLLLFGYLEELHDIRASTVATVIEELEEETAGVEQPSSDSDLSDAPQLMINILRRLKALEQRVSELEQSGKPNKSSIEY